MSRNYQKYIQINLKDLFYVVLRQKYIVSGQKYKVSRQKYIVSRQKNIRN